MRSAAGSTAANRAGAIEYTADRTIATNHTIAAATNGSTVTDACRTALNAHAIERFRRLPAGTG